MDVVELDGTSDIYLLAPQSGYLLKPLKINNSEKGKKIVKVTKKLTVKGGKTQLGFHDGRTLITDIKVNVGDSCLIQIPDQKILDVIKFEKNSQVLVIEGANVGQIGRINKINDGSFILQKHVEFIIGDKKIDIPARLVLVIGKEKPVIQIR